MEKEWEGKEKDEELLEEQERREGEKKRREDSISQKCGGNKLFTPHPNSNQPFPPSLWI